MKPLILFLFCDIFCVTSVLSEESYSEEFGEHYNCKLNNGTEVVDHWLQVPLDHFNLFDNRTWKMRYLVNDEYFEESGPLFIEIGGEWTIDGCAIIDGQLPKLAQNHKGIMVETEHRYYGKSLPFSTNFSTENLRYLQVEQALEDIAYFIQYFKSFRPGLQNSVVVIHGCSYAGMLVTWLRLRFPHVVDISYASSAPLGVKLNYPEYFEAINEVYANVSADCAKTLKRGFNTTEKLLRTEYGRKLVRDALREWKCGNIDKMDSGTIMAKMLLIINVQFDPLDFEDVACLIMLMDTDETDAFHRLAKFLVLKSNHIGGCSDENSNSMEDRNSLAWNYQTCTELGMFQTLNRKNSQHPFAMEFTLEESIENCVNTFNGLRVSEEVITSGIERVIRRYGGRRPKVTKVLTIQGTNDPWKRLADLKDLNSKSPVWVVNGSHCIDGREDFTDPSLIEIRKNIRVRISKWIDEIS